MTETTLSTH